MNELDEACQELWEVVRKEEMKIKIKKGLPPNYEAIRAKFPLTGNEIFTYGRTIYTPGRLSKALLAHERIHVMQQLKMGIDDWWAEYLTSEEFRYSQELEAHRAEFRAGEKLSVVAARLASDLYGNLVTLEDAKMAIANNA